MNRTIAPQTYPVNTIALEQPKIIKTKRGLPIIVISDTNDDAVKICFQFSAGKLHQSKPLQSSVALSLLLSGTKDKTSKAIEEAIDQLGGYTSIEPHVTESTLTVFALKQNINAILEIVFDAITHVDYNEKELALHLKRSQQNFQVNLEKVSTLARRTFTETLFQNTAIGKQVVVEDYNNISQQDCIDFYNNHIKNGLTNVSIVGNVDENTLTEIEHKIDAWKDNKTAASIETTQMKAITVHTEKKNAVQSAIRIGKMLFSPQNEDYIEFKVLNTILGGYFGSRLMSNIREDKGYTYGIGSGIGLMANTGYFYIATEVASKYREQTIAEVKKEIEILQNTLVSEEELNLVKKYISGQFLKNSDGAFALMDRFLFLENHNLPKSYYNDLITKTNAINSERIQTLAKQYLKWEDMNIISVG